MNDHICLKIEPRETDWHLGDGNLKLGAVPPVPSGDWTPYYMFFERQMLNQGDSDGCVLFTAQEDFDAQMEQKIQTGTIPQETLALFDSLGYMDIGTDGKKHFHSSPRWLQILTGNGLNGNNIYDPWDVMRKYGVLPYQDLPVDSTLTPEQYIDSSAITQVMKDKAMQFLAAIGGKNSIQYHWVLNNTHNFQATIPALPYAPLCDGVNVGTNWNAEYPTPPLPDLPPGHCVGRIKDVLPLTAVEYDHYLPNPKYLANYPISYSLQAIITVTPPPPAPLPPVANPVTPVQIQETQSWLSAILTWLHDIAGGLGFVKVVPLTSTIMKLKAYSMSAWKQSLLDIAIKVGVFAGVVVLNFVSASLTNGNFQLPYPALTLPLLTLLVSQLDSKFVAWSQEYEVPLPPAAPTV